MKKQFLIFFMLFALVFEANSQFKTIHYITPMYCNNTCNPANGNIDLIKSANIINTIPVTIKKNNDAIIINLTVISRTFFSESHKFTVLQDNTPLGEWAVVLKKESY